MKRTNLALRIREVRRELYGEDGAWALAKALNLPARTWLNYERGVTMPATVLLKFLEITNTDPYWLHTGEGGRTTVKTRQF